ncbi:MAG: WXG100 family type VII secretion target [Defluviitaleaceae bacterium]|nr:WXG100 family type VII secretion target [Defluviitaleaceae bacterium]
MSNQIRMTPETMRIRAGEVNGQGQAFQDVITRMGGIINELQSEWEGQASRAFADQFQRLQPAFNEMRELIDNIGMQLNQTANAVEDMDSSIARMFSN